MRVSAVIDWKLDEFYTRNDNFSYYIVSNINFIFSIRVIRSLTCFALVIVKTLQASEIKIIFTTNVLTMWQVIDSMIRFHVIDVRHVKTQKMLLCNLLIGYFCYLLIKLEIKKKDLYVRMKGVHLINAFYFDLWFSL